MAGLTFLYRSTKSRAPLKARLRFRHEGIDYSYESKTNVVVSKLYWSEYHSKQRISDPEIKNEKMRVASELNAIEKRVIDSFHNENVLKIDKSWLQGVIDDRADEKSSGLFIEVIDKYIEAKSKELTSSSIETYQRLKGRLKKSKSIMVKPIS